MKLHEVPKNTRYKIIGDSEDRVFVLNHIDGMYSVSFFGEILCHISAMADVEIVE